MQPLAGTTAVILAGGLGTRLRPAVGDRPKALAEVRGRPFLAWLIDRVAAAGIRTAVLCTGHGAEAVRSAMGETHGAVRLVHSPEPGPLGTGGALRHALPLIASDPALVFNGDSICDLDLAALWDRHEASGAAATIALTRVDDASRYGRVHADGAGAVVRFEEKVPGAGPGWINAGVYVLARRAIESIPGGRAVSIERDVFPAWIGKGLRGDPCGGRFIDIGTPEALAAAQEFLRGA